MRKSSEGAGEDKARAGGREYPPRFFPLGVREQLESAGGFAHPGNRHAPAWKRPGASGVTAYGQSAELRMQPYRYGYMVCVVRFTLRLETTGHEGLALCVGCLRKGGFLLDDGKLEMLEDRCRAATLPATFPNQAARSQFPRNREIEFFKSKEKEPFCSEMLRSGNNLVCNSDWLCPRDGCLHVSIELVVAESPNLFIRVVSTDLCIYVEMQRYACLMDTLSPVHRDGEKMCVARDRHS